MSDDLADLRAALEAYDEGIYDALDLANVGLDAGFGCLSEISQEYINAHGRVMGKADHIDLDAIEEKLIAEVKGLLAEADKQKGGE